MNNIRWASRWNYILGRSLPSYLQWFSVIFSALITMSLLALLRLMFQRYLHGNFTQLSQSKTCVNTIIPCYIHVCDLRRLDHLLRIHLSLSPSLPPSPPLSHPHVHTHANVHTCMYTHYDKHTLLFLFLSLSYHIETYVVGEILFSVAIGSW